MLELQNITKTFAKGTVNEKTALSGIDLTLQKGDFVTVWSVTADPQGRRSVRLLDPSYAGFVNRDVFVITESEKVYRKDSLLEYRGSISKADKEQFHLSM